MNIFSFAAKFNSEKSCRTHFKEERDKIGIICKRFPHKEHLHKTQKAGHGSKTKSNSMIMAESTVLEDLDTVKVDIQCRYFKAKVLDDHQTEGTEVTFKNAIHNEQTIVFTNKSTS